MEAKAKERPAQDDRNQTIPSLHCRASLNLFLWIHEIYIVTYQSPDMLPAPIKDTDSSFVLPDQSCQRFTLAQIQSATSNFDETLVIGRGGFGMVYKCAIEIGSVSQVAIKRLHSMSNQGAHEFEAEVKLLSKLRHANLVSLIGYCKEEKEMVLVYEFMPNGTLEDHLHSAYSCLSWLQRLKICIGAARGLDYLHKGTSTQHGVIHRDVKSSNILLDTNFDAKISDFGLAKIWQIDGTHSSTFVKGTFGFMDPCYVYTGKPTIKSDVYAFGVVLLEVLSGKKALDDTIGEQWGLAGWAQHQIKQGKLNQIIDPRLMGQISKKCLKEFARIACRCLHTEPSQRPIMVEVVFKLELILSQEREIASSVVDEERFIYKLRSLFTGEVEAATRSKSNFSLHHKRLKIFTYDELVTATVDFKYIEYSPRINEFIYKGWVDETTYTPTEKGVGLAMYVRKMENFTCELDIKLTEINHHNLVKLLGYCSGTQNLFCVYELILDKSLDKYLYGGTTSLSWVARLKIAIGAAEGLFYLQKRNQSAYSQFKTDLILVDTDFNARLSDFAFDSYTFRVSAYYADPKWFRYQADRFDSLLRTPLEEADQSNTTFTSFAIKSEIYAFGVVLLEMLTGMKVYDDERAPGKKKLVEWALPLLADEVNLGMIMDPQLQHNDCPLNGAFKMARLVSSCLQPKQDERPSMQEILQILNHCYHREIKTGTQMKVHWLG